MATTAFSSSSRLRAGLPATGRGLNIAVLVLLAAVLLQAVIEFTFTNIVAAATAASITLATWVYVFGTRCLKTHPLSTLALLGLNFVTTAEALIFQSLWLRPITYNLQSPLLTFWASTGFTLAALAAHFAYTHSLRLQAISGLLARRVWAPLWIFYPPTNFQLWIIGGVGFFATVVSRIVYGNSIEYGDVGGKFLQALAPFVAAPFFSLLRENLTASGGRLRPRLGPLAVYFGVIVLMAVVMNARGGFASIMLLVLLSYALALLTGRLVLGTRALIYFGAAGFAMIPVLLTAQDLATAMVLAREARSTQNLSYVVRETISAFNDKEALARFRQESDATLSTGGRSGYSEAYFASEFLQRLSLTKYTDLTITVSRTFSAEDRAYISDLARQQVLAQLPTPILNALSIPIDKNNLAFSTGDVYENIASNREVGSRLTGSTVTTVRDIAPWLWPLIVFTISLAAFIVYESLAIKLRSGWSLSVPGYLLLPTIFQQGLAGDSVANVLGLITRTTLTMIAVCAVLLLIGRVLEGVALPYSRQAS